MTCQVLWLVNRIWIWKKLYMDWNSFWRIIVHIFTRYFFKICTYTLDFCYTCGELLRQEFSVEIIISNISEICATHPYDQNMYRSYCWKKISQVCIKKIMILLQNFGFVYETKKTRSEIPSRRVAESRRDLWYETSSRKNIVTTKKLVLYFIN